MLVMVAVMLDIYVDVLLILVVMINKSQSGELDLRQSHSGSIEGGVRREPRGCTVQLWQLTLIVLYFKALKVLILPFPRADHILLTLTCLFIMKWQTTNLKMKYNQMKLKLDQLLKSFEKYTCSILYQDVPLIWIHDYHLMEVNLYQTK